MHLYCVKEDWKAANLHRVLNGESELIQNDRSSDKEHFNTFNLEIIYQGFSLELDLDRVPKTQYNNAC